MNSLSIVPIVLATFFATLAMLWVYRMRYTVAYWTAGVVAGFVGALIGLKLVHHFPTLAEFFAAFTCGLLAFSFVPRPRATISAKLRQKVISRHILKGGSFDPDQHEIDHIVPRHKGGSNTLDNLRVITKKENRRKGKRWPSFKDLVE